MFTPWGHRPECSPDRGRTRFRPALPTRAPRAPTASPCGSALCPPFPSLHLAAPHLLCCRARPRPPSGRRGQKGQSTSPPHSEGTGRAQQPGKARGTRTHHAQAGTTGPLPGRAPCALPERGPRLPPGPPSACLFLLTSTAVACLEAVESRRRRGQRPRVHTTQDPQRMQTHEHPFSACPVTSPRREPGLARFRDLRCSCSLSLFTVLNPQVRVECTVIHTNLVNKRTALCHRRRRPGAVADDGAPWENGLNCKAVAGASRAPSARAELRFGGRPAPLRDENAASRH